MISRVFAEADSTDAVRYSDHGSCIVVADALDCMYRGACSDNVDYKCMSLGSAGFSFGLSNHSLKLFDNIITEIRLP